MKILSQDSEIKSEAGTVRFFTLLSSLKEEKEIQRHLLIEVLSAR